MTDDLTSPVTDQPMLTIERPRLSNWAWRPWYAKLWWSLIAVYWAGAIGALLFGTLREFYGSDLAGFLNIALYPVFALIILSIGWLIAWKGALEYAAEHPEIENRLGWERRPYDFEFGREHPLDPMNPSSPIFIENANHSAFRS